MSLNITDNSVQDGKLTIHIAENGRSIALDCNETIRVESVMRFLESSFGIRFSDQVVLSSDVKLEPQKPLSVYKLPGNDDREVFVFNKKRLQSNSKLPKPEQLNIPEITEPPPPPPPPPSPLAAALHNQIPLDNALYPDSKVLPSYQKRFRYHYRRGIAIYNHTRAMYDNCERLLREIKVQERAIQTASSNFDQSYRIIHKNYSELMEQYKRQHRVQSDLLSNFVRDIEKLRSVKLHPDLQTESRKCLLDIVKEENLREIAENCKTTQEQFETKVEQFQKMFGEVKSKVEELFTGRMTSSVVIIVNLEAAIKENRCHVDEQKSIMQSLSKDVNTVNKIVNDCLSNELSSSLHPRDAVSALGPMYDVQNITHLPKMQECDRAISSLLESCRDKKDEMTNFLHNYMQKIAYNSHIIKNAKLRFHVFKEAMIRQDDDLFSLLKLVRGVGPSYRACFSEIVRRKATMKLYMGMAGHLVERLEMKREVEIGRRDEFLRTVSLYIPQDMLTSMGLYDSPNPCDVNISPFDLDLLDIDISDLTRYAPDTLAGLPAKFCSSQDDLDLPEDSELVVISGTSKMEVENVKLKAELSSAIALICSLGPEVEFKLLDESETDGLLMNSMKKTADALRLKDEYANHLQSIIMEQQRKCGSYEKRIQELEQKMKEKVQDNDDEEASTRCTSTSQPMNGGDLVNCLHEAREAAETYRCEADRKTSQYNALRASSVEFQAVCERLKRCVYAPGGVTGFTDSLRALARSLANTTSDDEEDDGIVEFRKCIRVLADKVGFLSGRASREGLKS